MNNKQYYVHHVFTIFESFNEYEIAEVDKSVSYFGDVTTDVDLMACSDVWRRTDTRLRQRYALSSP